MGTRNCLVSNIPLNIMCGMCVEIFPQYRKCETKSQYSYLIKLVKKII